MKLLGVGIDLVNLERVNSFLKKHSLKKVHRLLSHSERERFKCKKPSPKSFARLFSAKEAFFKTLDAPWLGVEGFSAIEVSSESRERFRIRCVGSEFGLKNTGEATGTFFSCGSLVGAEVIRWG